MAVPDRAPTIRAGRALLAALLALTGLVAIGRAATPARASVPTIAPKVAELTTGILDDGGAPLPYPASHIGVRWTGGDADVIELRWRTAAGWAPWQVVPINHDESDDAAGRMIGGLTRADGAVAAAVRAVAGAPRAITVVAIDAVTGTPGTRAAAAEPFWSSSTTTSTTTPRYPQPPVVSRAQWGADESIRRADPGYAPITKLIVHHTVTSNNDPDPASTVRAIYAYHVQSNGWDDIGYNFLIDEAGKIYEGRWARNYAQGEVPTGEDLNKQGAIGAHAEGANRGSVGIALLGTFTNQAPTPAAIDAVQRLLAWKADRHQIDPHGNDTYVSGDTTRVFPNIAGHRDTKATSCPGDLFYNRLPQVRQAVADLIVSNRTITPGYWVAGRDGAVYPFGSAGNYGSMAGKALNSPIVGMAQTVSGNGYWLLGSDGGIFSFGDAAFHGSTGNLKLNKPVIGLARTATGKGYWLVASDGGIFAFGDAVFHGSTGNIRLNQPVVGMAATTTGKGYWLVASDGGIFAFGDAAFKGSTGNIKLAQPVVSMAADPMGRGYWMVARDGGIFAFNVPFYGSVPGLKLPSYAGSVEMAATSTGRGYYVLGTDGGVFTFGDAKFHGAPPSLKGATAAADMVAVNRVRASS